MSNLNPLRIGIVGANWTLMVHAPAWRMIPGCEVTAVCTAHEETAKVAAAEENIEKAYWDYREMAADPDIDVIIVGTSPVTRFDIVMAAIDGGKHVYNCIPFAISAENAKIMSEAQKEKGVVGIVDAQFRWLPAMQYMRDLISQGALGDIMQATMEVQMPVFRHGGFHYPMSAHSGAAKPYYWLANKESGGSAWRNFGSHAILNLLPILGEIDEIIGEAKTVLKEWKLPNGDVLKPDTHDTAMALLRFRNGASANVNVGWAKPDSLPVRLEIWGTKGRFLMEDTSFGNGPDASLFYGDAQTKDMTGYSGKKLDIPDQYYTCDGTDLCKENYPAYVAPMVTMFANMAKTIREGGDGGPSFSEAAHVHCAIEAMEQSMATNCWQKV